MFVKIRVPFWVPVRIRHLVFWVPQKGTLILTTTRVGFIGSFVSGPGVCV